MGLFSTKVHPARQVAFGLHRSRDDLSIISSVIVYGNSLRDAELGLRSAAQD